MLIANLNEALKHQHLLAATMVNKYKSNRSQIWSQFLKCITWAYFNCISNLCLGQTLDSFCFLCGYEPKARQTHSVYSKTLIWD